MKFTFVGLTAIAIGAHTVLAACPCKAGDVSCFNKCVLDTNDCISNCDGDVKCYQSCIDNSWPGVEPATTSGETTTSTATRESTTTTTRESTTIIPSTLATVVPIPTSPISEAVLPSVVSGSSLPTMVGSIMPTSTVNSFLSLVSSAASEAASEMASLSSSAASENPMAPASSVVDQATSAIESSAEQATSALAPGSAVTTQNPEEVIENTGSQMIPALGLTILSVALTMIGF